MLSHKSSLAVVLLLHLISFVASHETDLDKELNLNFQEKTAFDKFKSQVNVTNAYGWIKTDLFLLRWIRAKNLDVNVAVRDMNDYLKWRHDHKMDTILSEDFTDFILEFPYNNNVTDLQGRPMSMGSIGDKWNIRRAIVQGKLQRLRRYAFFLVEEILDRLYVINQKHPNITQFSAVASLEGFNLFQQACPVCLYQYVELLMIYNRFYPNFAHLIMAINSPTSFSVVLDLLKPLLNKPTREALHVFGYNKKQWKAFLDQEVNPDNVTEDFGGNKLEDDDKGR